MDRLTTVAMYLPQFHRLPENDEWWGEGFTEWTAVKAAEKLFEGHNQCREPLNDFYYDLMEKDTMQWQADLAARYGVSGFCFYHYYFKGGRKILEKPAENLLKWKDINLSFCFCWANPAWARTWSNIQGTNAWSEKFEKTSNNQEAILLEQDYGKYEEWKAHFLYLLPFFKDERYIKYNNKPVFLFYKPDDIVELGEMLDCWNSLIQLEGYAGIYAIGVNTYSKCKEIDAILLQGPTAYTDPKVAGMYVKESWENGVRTYNYQEFWRNAIASKGFPNIKTYYGGMVDFDDTPRRGRLGTCMLNVTPELFEENLYKVAVKNIVSGNGFLFINAWNEWGEGNYLEPDKKYGYKYLDAVKRVMDACNAEGFNAERAWIRILEDGKRDSENDNQALLESLNKFRSFYKVLDRWLLLKEKDQGIEKYFTDNGYRKVVIYGFAAMGKHLYEELKNSSVEVVCALDRRQGLLYNGIEIQNLEADIPECDVIIVTAIADFNEIAGELKRRTAKPIVSLQDVIFY